MSTAATPSRRARPKAVGFGIQAGVRAHQRAIEISALMLVAALAGFLFLSRESLWLDEAYSVTLAGSGWGTIWQQLSFSEANGSPYYILLHFWLVLGKSEFAVDRLGCREIGNEYRKHLVVQRVTFREFVSLEKRAQKPKMKRENERGAK